MKNKPLVADHPPVLDRWAYEINSSLGLDPNQLTIGSRKKVHLLCDKGHTWSGSLADIVKRGIKCSVCSGKTVLVGFNDFKSNVPDKAKFWDYTKNSLNPEDITTHSGKKVFFTCDRGHSFESTPNKVSAGHWCKYCANKAVYVGDNDLLTTDPDIASEWDYELNYPLTPKDVTRGHNKKMWWVCSADSSHKWETKVSDRTTESHRYGCNLCNSRGSKGQTELYKYITMNAPDLGVILDAKGLLSDRRDIDVYIPELKIGFEFNGLFYHSDGPRGSKSSVATKTSDAQDAGIDLYTVWEDDWKNNQTVVKKWIDRMIGISSETKIDARKCSVVSVSTQECADFLNRYHIQGNSRGSIKIGLQLENSLVAVAVFSSWQKGAEIRLDRYATSANVRGGFSKIMTWVDRNISYERVITFADLCHSKGRLYSDTGWVVDGIINPDYSYLLGKKRVHKFNFRLDNFKNDKKVDGSRKWLYREGATEHELAQMNQLYRVYDAGKIRYVRTNPTDRSTV